MRGPDVGQHRRPRSRLRRPAPEALEGSRAWGGIYGSPTLNP